MSETNPEINKIIKQRHELIRRLETKEITIEEFDQLNKECQDKIAEIEKKGRVEEKKEAVPIVEKKIDRSITLGDKSVEEIAKVIYENPGRGIKDWAEIYIQTHKTVSKSTASVYMYHALHCIKDNRVKGYVFYDKNMKRLFKKGDLIDEQGNQVA